MNARFVGIFATLIMAEVEFEAVDIADLILRCREVCVDSYMRTYISSPCPPVDIV